MQHLIEQAVAATPLAQLVVGGDGSVIAASAKARQLLRLPRGVDGLPFAAVARECDAEDIAAIVRRAADEPVPIAFYDCPWRSGDEARLLNGGAAAIRDAEGRLLGVTLTFDSAAGGETTDTDDLKRDVSELRSINDELRQRTDELNLVAIFLESVLTSLRGAVLVVDTSMTVRVWNPQAERLWGIKRRDALGSRLHDLALRVPWPDLGARITAALGGEVELDDWQVDVPRDDGSQAAYSVSATPLLGPGGSVHGATLLFVEHGKR